MKKLIIVVCTILIVLMILNPTLTDFKEYTGAPRFGWIQKDRNYLLFSTYTERHPNKPDEHYLGICKNFFKK